MPLGTIRAWLGLDAIDDKRVEPLRETLEALEHLEPGVARYLAVISAADEGISTAEEGEIHRVANELRIDAPDLTALRVRFSRYLPGLSRPRRDTDS
jgi:hypothetical protein